MVLGIGTMNGVPGFIVSPDYAVCIGLLMRSLSTNSSAALMVPLTSILLVLLREGRGVSFVPAVPYLALRVHRRYRFVQSAAAPCLGSSTLLACTTVFGIASTLLAGATWFGIARAA